MLSHVRARDWRVDIAKDVGCDLRHSLRPFVVFDLFFKATAAAMLVPAAAWVAGSVVSSSGQPAVSNEEIVSFLISWRGVIWLLAAGTTGVALVFAEHGGVMLIAAGGRQGRRRVVPGVLWSILRLSPRLLKLGALYVGAHLALAAPFVAMGAVVHAVFLSSYDIYYLVTVRPPVWWLAAGLWALLAGGVVVVNGNLYVRWVLALPAMIFEELTPREAVRRSARLMLSARWRKGSLVLGCALALALLSAVPAVLFEGLGRLVFLWVPETSKAAFPIALLLVSSFLALSVALSFAAIVGHSLLLVHLYARASREDGATPIAAEFSSPAAPEVAPLLTWRVAWLAIAVAVAFGFYNLNAIRLEDHVEITAHRGSSRYAPENQETADGVIVLLHDEDFLRLSGVDRKIWDLTYDEVRALDVGRWFDASFEGERVPTLTETIATARGRIKLNVELKYNGHERRLAERVVEILHAQDFTDEVLVTSLNFEGLRRVRELDPDIRVGHVVAQAIGNLVRLDGDALSVSARSASRGSILAVRGAGKDFHVWTVNDPVRMAHYIDLGVDNIITDEPVVLKSLLAERAALSREELLLWKVRNWFWR
jgi:glycerophosphoryl diester phosphodiesterase